MSFDGGRGKSEREGGPSRSESRFLLLLFQLFPFLLPSFFPPFFVLRSALPFGQHGGGAVRIPHAKRGRKKREREEKRERERESCASFLSAVSVSLSSLSPFALLSSSLSLNRARGPPRREKNSFWISNSSRFKITCSSRHRGKRRKEERRKEKKSKVVEVEVEREIAKKRAPKRTS